MATIDADFDAHKELTSRRSSESVTYNDVIRGMLGWDTLPRGQGPDWVYKGVVFADGTRFRATYKGLTHVAEVSGGGMMLDGVSQTSPSAAAHHITGNQLNGWDFWKYRRPQDPAWRSLGMLRDGT